MADGESLRTAEEFAALARGLIAGEKTEGFRPQEIDLRALYAFCEKHTITAFAAAALEAAGIRDAEFHEAFVKALRKVLALERDLTELQRRLDEQDIWYMPLKGAILKDDYPRLGLREMSDCDVLYDGTRAGDVRRILGGMGYRVDEYDMHNVDSYEKPPVCRFEMHRKLFSPYLDGRLYDYYRDVKQRLVRDENTRCGWRFTNEDFYAYLLAHEYKHYMTGGNGLRFLLDTWVYLRKHGEELDRETVGGILDRLGLRDFEEKNRALAFALFEGRTLDQEQKKMLEYMLDAGTFGTVDNAVRHQVERLGGGVKGKLRFVKERLVIPARTLESAYPFFYRHRALMPALYAYRLWKAAFRSREKVAAELRTILRRERND